MRHSSPSFGGRERPSASQESPFQGKAISADQPRSRSVAPVQRAVHVDGVAQAGEVPVEEAVTRSRAGVRARRSRRWS